jgi:hypothetical protein
LIDFALSKLPSSFRPESLMRTLILMPDWNAVLFYRDAKGSEAVDEDSLPISTALKRELRDFYAWFSEMFLHDDPREPISDMDRRLMDNRGVELWECLSRELSGAYRVIFHSHELHRDFDRPEEFKAMRDACV